MPLNPGTRLGPYEIVSPLGAGGMGEVYRARDTRLGREVAVKVLPQHLSSSPEVRARFEREAKTVSSLNHPNICTLHDIGREGETDYLVMELIEGETLAQRLTKGALPGGEVLRIGAQIADALDRAHRAGVMHRDLKPGNVMLTKSGAKLMDFGLARATGLTGLAGSGISVAGLTQSPTVAHPLTAEGTILGTFQYMSPEQMEGREADTRSDLWSLGCVIYEMATGRRAFEGRSQASLISSIMSAEPPAISQIAPMAPAGLDRLVRNCLTKDPEERVQTAHDVKLQLQGIAEGGSQAGVPAPVVTRRRSRERLAWSLAAIATVAALAALAVALLAPKPAPKRPVQLSLTPPEHEDFLIYWSSAAIAPDGHALAFGAGMSTDGNHVWLQSLDSPEASVLTESGNAGNIFWSPDSKSVAYLDLKAGALKTIAVAGGTPVTLCPSSSGRGGSWNRHGDILFAPVAQGPLYRIPASGGEPVQATWLDSARHELGHRFPTFLPDGDHFLFVSMPSGPEGFDIYAGSLSSKTVQKIFTARSAATYAEPGYLLFVRGHKVMAQRFDPAHLALQGDPVALADAPPESDMDAEPVASASRDGRLVFMVDHPPDTQLEWLDRSGVVSGKLPLPAGNWSYPRLSPDDRYAVLGNGDDLWRLDLQRSVATRLTSNGGTNSSAVWSPDGSRIAFTISHTGREEIVVMNSDGSGQSEPLTTTNNLFKSPEDWVKAGLIFNDIGSGTIRDLWILPTSGEKKPVPLIQTRFAEYGAAVSPDERWIAYVSNEAGQADVYIQSFPVIGHKVRVSSDGAMRAWWMPGGEELCYISAVSGDVMSVKLARHGEELEVGAPRTLFSRPPGAVGDFTHDGKRMLVAVPTREVQGRKLRVILDWTGLLDR